ncbi:hypothetical protein ONE63_008065 [Megalurothrips usitatus]|uniref:Uncharacterized protein n=1 Tax=Megalurothrips usitatus TaxID=439358 RepID=A0AAV7XUJ1_9NEOP|nr:hypothetical protein ONE63_008065 [Megalurothrips usitatus]
MVLEKDLKNSEGDELIDKDRLKEALEPLVNELIDLKENGIIIDGEKIQVCVMFLLGDSLGQNFIGRFVQNFSSAQFSCRFRTMSKDEFFNDPSETKSFRTVEEYNNYVDLAKAKWQQVRRQSIKAQQRTAPNRKVVRNLQSAISASAFKRLLAINYRGVKYRPSPFNRSKLRFHVVSHQPPCLAHDLFEGIIKAVVPNILKSVIERGWFDLKTLNRRIAGFTCKGTDALDKPKPLKSLDSLCGNAVENWNFLRLLPLIIGDLIQDEEDPHWQMILNLQEITALVCAPKISRVQVEYLRSLIGEYLCNVKEHFPEKLTPKHHYLGHYTDLILRFGTLLRLFTLRFESRHAFFKRVIKTCRNYINITYTMARKYMCRSAYDRSTNLLPDDVLYKEKSSVDLGVIPEELRVFISTDFQELEKLSIFGTEYQRDHYLILGSHEGSALKVGSVKKMFLKLSTNEVYFLLQEQRACNTYRGYYQIEETPNKSFILKAAEELADYYPLPAYIVNGKSCLCLKHSVICMHEGQ